MQQSNPPTPWAVERVGALSNFTLEFQNLRKFRIWDRFDFQVLITDFDYTFCYRFELQIVNPDFVADLTPWHFYVGEHLQRFALQQQFKRKRWSVQILQHIGLENLHEFLKAQSLTRLQNQFNCALLKLGNLQQTHEHFQLERWEIARSLGLGM